MGGGWDLKAVSNNIGKFITPLLNMPDSLLIAFYPVLLQRKRPGIII